VEVIARERRPESVTTVEYADPPDRSGNH